MLRKPDDFRRIYRVANDVTYRLSDQLTTEKQAGIGWLSAGSLVWLTDTLDDNPKQTTVEAYASSIGVISIDPRCLARVRQ